jgi:hypothetical protein
MRRITALLHTENDALRLGRALETLYPCDEILILDHHSRDATCRVAREYGARIVTVANGTLTSSCLHLASYEWIFCLQPTESISEGLQASLYEWKSLPEGSLTATAFSVLTREETTTGWVAHPVPETRLVPRQWNSWGGLIPNLEPASELLHGELLRFAST